MHTRFHYDSLEELESEVADLNLPLIFDRDLAPLSRKVKVLGFETPNSLGIHPMEGCDGTADGKPGELTFRRYQRFAAGGAGLIWFEATAVVPEGRANPRQLLAVKANTGALADLLQKATEAGIANFGTGHRFLPVIQLTHSGRYSKPEGKPRPIIAQHNPFLDPGMGIDSTYPVITDDELERLEDEYVRAAGVAYEAGFPIVDIKACHRYLISELLGSHLRSGRYGGSFENRTRFLLNIVAKIKDKYGDNLKIATRLNVWDAMPYPYGWGVGRETEGQEPGPLQPDLTEIKRLLKELILKGVGLVNITLGNPYYNPHFNRPYDQPAFGLKLPEEHPLVGVARMFTMVSELQQTYPEVVFMGTGYSWLRQFAGNAAAANLRLGRHQIAGFGREAFAYPDFARDLLEKGELNRDKLCIACSKCTDIMRNNGMTGCVVRDASVYAPIYRQSVKQRA